MIYSLVTFNVGMFQKALDLDWSETKLLTYIALQTPRGPKEKKTEYNERIASMLNVGVNTLLARAKELVDAGVIDEDYQPVNTTDWDALKQAAKEKKEAARLIREEKMNKPYANWWKFLCGADAIVEHVVPYLAVENALNAHGQNISDMMKANNLTDDDLRNLILFIDSRYKSAQKPPTERWHFSDAAKSIEWWVKKGKPTEYTPPKPKGIAGLLGEIKR